jgi:hypothetical protein
MTVIERLVWEVRQRADEKIFKHLVTALTTEQMEKLDHTVSHMPESSKTYLAWLRFWPLLWRWEQTLGTPRWQGAAPYIQITIGTQRLNTRTNISNPCLTSWALKIIN